MEYKSLVDDYPKKQELIKENAKLDTYGPYLWKTLLQCILQDGDVRDSQRMRIDNNFFFM